MTKCSTKIFTSELGLFSTNATLWLAKALRLEGAIEWCYTVEDRSKCIHHFIHFSNNRNYKKYDIGISSK